MKLNESQICVLGAGYVGLTSAVIFANSGYKVHLIEPNVERLSAIKNGRSFFFEAGLDNLIKNALESGTMTVSGQYTEMIRDCRYIFSCVGTPANQDGSPNLDYVFSAATKAMKYAQTGAIFVQKSTVPPGTGAKILETFASAGSSLSYISNPEFLREGTAVIDTLVTDRIVTGGIDQKAISEINDIYMKVSQSKNDIANISGISLPDQKATQYIVCSIESAELIKVSSNAFLALKISFANSIAMLADATKANVIDVMSAVGADDRIGTAFLNAGRGYGGGCFPKDVSGLIKSAIEHGIKLEIMQAVQKLNASMPNYIVEKIRQCKGGLIDKRVTVLGLAFKSGTSDVRQSPGIAIANLLAEQGARVTTYDPEAIDEAAPELSAGIVLERSLPEAVKSADVIVIATDWPEIKALSSKHLTEANQGLLVVDAMNCLNKTNLGDISYIGVGQS